MYKVGDEVLIKADITDVSDCSERPYFVAPDIYSVNWVSEDKIIPMDKTYEMGLSDAWELADKVYEMRNQQRYDVFGTESLAKVMDLSPQEALAKIKAYEKEKEIKVGDVVHHIGGKTFIVTYIHDDGYVSGITEEGGIYSRVGIGNVVKSDKHIDIESLLKEIGE